MKSVIKTVHCGRYIRHITAIAFPLILGSACGTGTQMSELTAPNTQSASGEASNNPLELITQGASASDSGNSTVTPDVEIVPVITALPVPEVGEAEPSVEVDQDKLVAAGTETDMNELPGLDPETPVSCSAPASHMQQRTLELINAARSEARLCGQESYAATEPLSWSTTLANAAKTHSDDMAEHNFFDHTGSDGSTIGIRVTSTGYLWRTVGENIAAGQSTAATTIQGWIDSPGHCRNLMNPAFTEVAVSCSEDSGALYTRYWTNVLAAPR